MTLAFTIGGILRFVLTLSMVFAAINTDWLSFGVCLGIFVFILWLEEKEFSDDEE